MGFIIACRREVAFFLKWMSSIQRFIATICGDGDQSNCVTNALLGKPYTSVMTVQLGMWNMA